MLLCSENGYINSGTLNTVIILMYFDALQKQGNNMGIKDQYTMLTPANQNNSYILKANQLLQDHKLALTSIQPHSSSS
jgi:hypothetical protein